VLLENKTHLVVIGSNVTKFKSYTIHKCTECSIYILGNIENLMINECTNVKIYSVVKGTTMIKNSTCELSIFTGRLVNDTSFVTGYLGVTKRCIVLSGTLTVYPPNIWHHGLGLELDACNLNLRKNNWKNAILFPEAQFKIGDIENYFICQIPFQKNFKCNTTDQDLIYNSLPPSYKSYCKGIDSVMETTYKIMARLKFVLKLEADIFNAFHLWLCETGKMVEVMTITRLEKDVR
jgi:hypothetical protein